jgi:hypothetical protein
LQKKKIYCAVSRRGFLTAGVVSRWICNPVVAEEKNILRRKSPGIFYHAIGRQDCGSGFPMDMQSGIREEK